MDSKARFPSIYALVLGLLFSFFMGDIKAYDLPPRPEPAIYVNDFAGIFSAADKQQLEYELRAYFDSTSTQIVVVTVKSLEGDDASNYAINLGLKWKVGQKGKNNGVIFLVAPNERKMFIATGYGVEEKLTDVYLTRIRENYILPEFKKGNYYSGVRLGVQLMMQRLSGQFVNDKKGQNHTTSEITFFDLLMIFLVLLFFLWIISKMAKRANYSETYSGRGYRQDRWDGGGFWGGGFGGGFGGGSSGGGWSGGGSFGGGDFGGGGSGGDW